MGTQNNNFNLCLTSIAIKYRLYTGLKLTGSEIVSGRQQCHSDMQGWARVVKERYVKARDPHLPRPRRDVYSSRNMTETFRWAYTLE